MVYLLQINCYAALLFGIYLLLLKNRAAHSWSRAYLIICAMLPLALPFIQLPGLSGSLLAITGSYQLSLPAVNISSTAVNTASASWAVLLYAAIAAILLGRVVAQYLLMRSFVTRHEPHIMQHARVLLNTGDGPGSFGPYIFLPGSDIDPAIFEHELAHIRLRHSADIVLLRLLQVCFWPNIMLYAISRELRLVHEFQADALAAGNRDSYIATLLNSTFHTNHFRLSHTFFHHPLKRRIMMLDRSPVSRAKMRITTLQTAVAAAIVLSSIIYLQSCKPQDKTQVTEIQQAKESKVVYETADKMPEPSVDLGKYLGENIKYPEAVLRNHMEGRVVVKFVVDETGIVSDATIIKSDCTGPSEEAAKTGTLPGSDASAEASKAMEAEALRVVSQMPKWTPGEKDGKKVSVSFNLPIVFRL